VTILEGDPTSEVIIIDFASHFAPLPDPRGHSNARKHELLDILCIALCAMLCGAESFFEMELFGRAKEDWLRQRLGLHLPSGVPSHDTFGRLFARLDPTAFSHCFTAWTQSLHTLTHGQVIALDGKTLRRSFDSATGRGALQVVSAWASANQLCLGQVIVDAKSNEITAIPALLQLLDIRGCVVTVDALNSQKEIAAQIQQGGGDYIMALKENHPLLHTEVQDYFAWARQREGEWSPAKAAAGQHLLFDSTAHSIEYGHGRREERRAWAVTVTSAEWPQAVRQWPGLQSLVLVESARAVHNADVESGPGWQDATHEQRYFLSSLPADAPRLLQAVRDHWGIENSLHWVLDMAFDEDHCRIRKDHAGANVATLRHLALNLLRQGPGKKGGIKARRRQAGWNEDYIGTPLFPQILMQLPCYKGTSAGPIILSRTERNRSIHNIHIFHLCYTKHQHGTICPFEPE
jgi:predicted transposase YbfD/YdcC